MVNTHHTNGMLQVSDGIEHGGLATLLAQETMIECDVGHTTLLCQGPQLVVGEIARMIAERTAVGMATDDRLGADVKGVPETLLRSVAEVHHDAAAVHLTDGLLSKIAHAVMRLAPTCRVAKIVIAIMTERDIGHATLGKMLHVGQIVLQRQSIFYGEENRLASLPLVLIEIGRTTCDTQTTLVGLYNLLYFVEDQVSIVGGGNGTSAYAHRCLKVGDVFFRQAWVIAHDSRQIYLG